MVAIARKSTRVIEGYDGPTRAWLYTLASMTGLRRGELATLTPKSFDWENSSVTVPAAYTKNKETAVLPLPRRLAADLEEWLAGKRGPIFENLRRKRTRKMIKADLEAAGLPYKTDVGTRCFHSLRNSYISSLFDAGCSVATVQRLARHSDVKMTMRYAKPRTDEWEVVNDLAYPLATQSTTQSKSGPNGADVRKTR